MKTLLIVLLLDPTIFAPAGVSYYAQKADWDTSQVFFQHGWVEANPSFTLSRQPFSAPISHKAGMRIINKWSVETLMWSSLHNTGSYILTAYLTSYQPNHKKLIKVISWSERIIFASIITYYTSSAHFHQASLNRKMAKEYGY